MGQESYIKEKMQALMSQLNSEDLDPYDEWLIEQFLEEAYEAGIEEGQKE
jgi:hypothetical protein